MLSPFFKGKSLKTKISMHQAGVLTTFLYGSEYWIHINQLNVFHRCCRCLIWGYQNILYNLNLDGLVRLSAWVITLPKVLLYSHTFLVYVTLDFKYMLKYSWSHQHLKSIEITAIYQAEWSIINFVKPPQTFEKL